MRPSIGPVVEPGAASRRGVLGALLVLVALLGCATPGRFEEAQQLLAEGKSEQGLAQLEKAYADNPRSAPTRAALLRERERQAGARLAEADAALKTGRLDEAEAGLRKAADIDPGNPRVGALLMDLQRARNHERVLAEAQQILRRGDAEAAEQRVRAVLAENPYNPAARALLREAMEAAVQQAPTPQLKAPFRKPITLEFRDAPIRTVFDLLAKTSGVNFVFDREVRTDQKISVFMRNTSMEDVLRLLLTTNGLDRKVLNENSVLVYPNTPAKQKDYRELVVRSYYLSNADVKQVSALVKAMVKTQDVFVDEKLNLLVLKDSPEVVRLTDQLVRTLDVAEPEVMLEVEVLEVARTRLQEIGVRYPGSVSLGAAATTTTGTGTSAPTTTTAATTPVDGPMIFTTANPLLVFNLRASVNQTNILANPRIRVKNREKARIHIGDKVPVFTSTATANVGVSTSVTYLDVGLKLDVESQVYLNDEVAIKAGLEVSNIIETVSVPTGTGSTVAYRVGTRNTSTVLQLRDGETQILAGLISDEDRRSATRIPGLGDLPLLTRLFGNQQDNRVKTEIVLLITPRIVRNIYRPEGLVAEMPVGTDAMPGAAPLRISATRPGQIALAPAGAAGPAPGGAVGGVTDATAAPPSADPSGAAAEAVSSGSGVLLVGAPVSARSGSEIVVSLSLSPGGQAVRASAELVYDPTQLEPTGATAASPGRLPVRIEGAGAARFRILAEGGRVQLRIEAAKGQGSDGNNIALSAPGAIEIAVQ